MSRVAALPAPLERQRRWLGFAGLAPFVACLAVLAASDAPALEAAATQALLHYAAVIAAFLGAVHWGLAGDGGGTQAQRLWWGVTPALLAWALLATPTAIAMAGFAVLFALILLVDLRWLKIPDPGYRALRVPLTTTVVGVMLASAALRITGT